MPNQLQKPSVWEASDALSAGNPILVHAVLMPAFKDFAEAMRLIPESLALLFPSSSYPAELNAIKTFDRVRELYIRRHN